MQQIAIPILSDTLRSEELYSLLAQPGSETHFKLMPNEQVTRSSLADPTVVAALIGAGATTLAALVGLIGVLWSSKRKAASTGQKVIIEIRLNKGALQREPVQEADASSALYIPVSSAGEVTDQGSPYAKMLAEIAPEQVQHIAILEDE